MRQLIRTATTLETKWWQVCGEVCLQGQSKMNQVLGTFGLLDFTMSGPFSPGACFETYELFISLVFQIFFRATVYRG
jgi:hypothetical protein